jgi:serine/threonine protein kinase
MNRIKQGPDPEAPIREVSIAQKPGADAPSIPDHQLLRLIASGAYGEVWLTLSAVGTPRAVKIVQRDQHATSESFEREFKGLQKFEPVSRSHEGLVDILTLGLLPDRAGFYYVMELADGLSGPLIVPTIASAEAERTGPTPEQRKAELETYAPRTLRADLKLRGALPAEEVIEFGLKLTAALAYLHAQGLIHRDVKPSNILLIGGVPKLADAGLVAAVDDARSLVGTAGYIAPEGPGKPQADLYALGKVLYEATFGQDRQEFPSLPADVASRPYHMRVLELNEIIVKACAHDPRQRYQNAPAMLADLQLLDSGKSVRQKHLRQRLWTAFNKVGLAAALIALISTLVLRFTQGGAEDYVRSHDPEVNKLVAQGFYAWRESTPQRIKHAEECFQRALAREPDCVPALYGLSAVYLDDRTKFRDYTEQIKRIAPESAEAWGNVAFDEWQQGQFRKALTDAKLATQKRAQCEEGRVWAHGGYGYFLQNVGDIDGALRQYRLAEKVMAGTDPTILDHLGHIYYMRSNFVEALKYYQASIDFMPTHLNGRYWKARTLEEMDRFDDAIREYKEADLLGEQDPGETNQRYEALSNAYHHSGPAGYWGRWLADEVSKPSPDFYRVAMFYARLGKKDRAYDNLEKAFEKVPFAGELMVDLCWDHNDQRSKAFARKIGLTK